MKNNTAQHNTKTNKNKTKRNRLQIVFWLKQELDLLEREREKKKNIKKEKTGSPRGERTTCKC
jgi:hypothetical protein